MTMSNLSEKVNNKSNNILILFITYFPDIEMVNKINYISAYYNCLVVDNTEFIDKKDVLLTNQCTCEVLINGANVGVAKALNMGCKAALDAGYRFVITMDQDSNINSEVIDELLEFYKNNLSDKISIISPRHILQGGVASTYDAFPLDVTSDGIFTMTSGNLLDLSIWKEIGGFSDDLFIDFVDIDYYCKSLKRGARVITLNTVTMKHNLGDLKVKRFIVDWKVFNHSSIRKYYQIRNVLIMLKRHSSDYLPRGFVFRYLINLIITTTFFEKNKLSKIKMMFYGLKDFFLGRMGKFQN